PEIGKVVSVGFTMYEYEGFLIKETKNFYMETVNIYTTPGMAIRSESSENLYFNRTNLMLKPGSKRLMTATADGLHAADTVGDIIVSNSIFEYSHDDSINIKTFYFKVDSVLRNKVTLNMTTTEVRIPINVGDQLEFFEDNTFSSKAIRTVTAVEAYGTTYEITLNENLSTGLVNQGDLVGNISRVPKVSIENSIFRNKRNRGILVQVRDSRIINSAFYNIIHGPIMVHAAFDVFAEAIVPQNITIQNCKFINNNQASGLNGDISVFRYGGEIVSNTIKQITISNNYFYHSAYRAIYLLGTGDVTITNNLFQDVAINVSGDSGKNNAIYIKTCIDTTITDNLIYMTNDKAYFMFLYATDDVNTITSNNLNRNKENE
ncbi:MAG: right-handed parallel beta-helix repeat-containing protein, partial [Acholeplasmataceae bacterium]